MKKITLTIYGEPDYSKDFEVPEIDIQATLGMSADEKVGIMLVAYQMMIHEFISQHDKNCKDCPAYKQHTLIRQAIREVNKRLAKENNG